MIKITATAESVAQAKDLLEAGIDTIYIGEEKFGLRLPFSFSLEEIEEITREAHRVGREVCVAVNGIMHPKKMREFPEYLNALKKIQVDKLAVGDPGVMYLLSKEADHLPFIYDGATMVTNSRQINFWANHTGAIGAVIAREVPFKELEAMSKNLCVFGEILVYGATAIHQSKRPLLQNYYDFIRSEEEKGRARDLYLSEPKKEDTHYSIFEDQHGTHIFANNDINLMQQLDKLVQANYTHWKLEGLYTKGADFVAIATLFVRAKEAIEKNTWTQEKANLFDEELRKHHPKSRGLDEGFFHLNPEEIS